MGAVKRADAESTRENRSVRVGWRRRGSSSTVPRGSRQRTSKPFSGLSSVNQMSKLAKVDDLKYNMLGGQQGNLAVKERYAPASGPARRFTSDIDCCCI